MATVNETVVAVPVGRARVLAALSVHTGRADSPEGPAALDDDAPATELLASDPSCSTSRPPTTAGPSRGDRIMSSDRSTRICRRRHNENQGVGSNQV